MGCVEAFVSRTSHMFERRTDLVNDMRYLVDVGLIYHLGDGRYEIDTASTDPMAPHYLVVLDSSELVRSIACYRILLLY